MMSLLKKKEVQEAIEWYVRNRGLYLDLCYKVKDIISDNLEQAGIPYVEVQNRVKEINSFEKKLNSNVSFKPKDMQDLAGIRVICYVISDVNRISDLIRSLFHIDEARSSDKATNLGSDRVGYKSIHLVAKFKEDRIALSEYKKFSGLFFEIQIRTILQHAWAEIQHDNNYKFSGVLPQNLQRRLYLVSGQLEIADNEFEVISKLIDTYAADVSQKTKEGDLNIPINSTSLRQFLIDHFSDIPTIENKFGPNDDMSERLVKECFDMGFKTLADLQAAIPLNFKENIAKYEPSNNFCGILRNIFVIFDSNRYFTKIWPKVKWVFSRAEEDYKIYSAYGIDIKELSKKYSIDMINAF